MANIQTQTAMYLLIGLDEALRPRIEGYEWENSPGGMLEATMWIEDELAPQVMLLVTTRNVQPETDLHWSTWLYKICEGIGGAIGNWVVKHQRWPEQHEVESDCINPMLDAHLQDAADFYRENAA